MTSTATSTEFTLVIFNETSSPREHTIADGDLEDTFAIAEIQADAFPNEYVFVLDGRRHVVQIVSKAPCNTIPDDMRQFLNEKWPTGWRKGHAWDFSTASGRTGYNVTAIYPTHETGDETRIELGIMVVADSLEHAAKMLGDDPKNLDGNALKISPERFLVPTTIDIQKSSELGEEGALFLQINDKTICWNPSTGDTPFFILSISSTTVLVDD